MDEIVGLLEGLGYEARKVGGGDPSADTFDDESSTWSSGWLATGDSKPALIIWSGHGVHVDGQTRLVLSDLKPVADPGQWKTRVRRQGVTADDLVSAALGSGAEQILLVIDTCYAGGGTVPALGLALSRWEEESAPPGQAKWLGVVASCQSQEVSDSSGPLLAALTDVLREGRQGTEYNTTWSDHNAFVSGQDLLDALDARWGGEGQTLVRATLGTPRPAFPNPLHSPEAPARLVEHLVQAARGVGYLEEGWFFTGRTGVLGEIVEWLGKDAPGLFLVTGPAGCGKSAVLGRIATLADPEQRARAEENGALRQDDPDPGVRAEHTLAAVHLRDLTPLQAAERLARDLELPRPRSTDDFRAEVRELSPQPVLVMDGLDEVPAEHTQSVIEELVFPLSRSVPVLLGSRERVFRSQQQGRETLPETLARLIGAHVTTVDLEDEPHTREDIGEYVRRRCEAAGMAEGPAREAGAAIAERATDVGGGFLFARLVTSTVLARVDSGDDGSLLTDLPDSIDAAFENELRAVPARVRDDGTILPSAAWDLLTALAWTVGQGMPAGGVWEAVAGALGGGVEYDETDVDWALSAFGRYIVEDAEEGQAVYRLYHREFVAHLRRREGPGGVAAGEVVLRTLVDLLEQQGRVGDWSGVDPYVTRGLVRHAVQCGGAGVDVLRGVAAWDEESGLPHLAEGLHGLCFILSNAGLRDEALKYARAAVGLYKELSESDPNTYRPDLADSLNSLAICLAENGARQDALTAAHEALRIRRTLAEQHPATHTADLASALNNLASRLAAAGDRQGALAPALEATNLFRALTEQHPSTHTPNLATSLDTLANHLADTGEHPSALGAAHEALRIRRTLAEQHPATHTPNLASALNNLANHLTAAGDHQGALAPAREATNLFSALAEQHPATNAPDLATSLDTLAICLAETGARQDALTAAHEALRIRRILAEQHPATHTPNLAKALNNLANHLIDAGDPRGALTAAREATGLFRTLADQDAAAFTPDLATSLNNLAIRLTSAGDHQRALAAAHEATGLFHTLAELAAAIFTPDFASSLSTLATCLANAGARQDALTAAHEAVRIRRILAEQHPATHTPNLANALNNLAIRLSETGDHQRALAPAHEAVRIRRALAEQHPTIHAAGLAGSLDNLASHLANTRDHQGALAAAREATGLFRTLAEQDAAAFTPGFATSLSNLAVRLSDTGDNQGALALAREAVDIRRALAEQHPATYTPHLATSLNTLAICLAETGDQHHALTIAHEATNLFRTLAGQHPATYIPNLATSLSNLADHFANAGDPSAAVQTYERVIADLSTERPAAGRIFALGLAEFLMRRRECSTTAGLRRFAQLANTSASEASDEVTFEARNALRSYVREHVEHREEVAALWQEEFSVAPPAWLTLSPQALATVGAWLYASTWADSYAQWAQHAELLSSLEGAVALTEYALLSPDSAADHQALRKEILAQGAPAAYRPRILGEQFADWAEVDTWEESEQYLQAHPDLLHLTPPGSTPAALLHVARTHDIPAAYALVRDRTALQQYIDNALATGDADALRHAASIEDEVYDDQLSARTHHQAALLLAGTPDEADPTDLALLVADASPDTRNRLISETAILSATHAQQHAAHWARIIQALAGRAEDSVQ
ncbi:MULTISPECIES: tetratricopeptide repeat protein [unclassified Streptomyces]|uniref:tetratricopeptide repeat protein n=1 Tax=unclassified Streptomyces TaxID=2593676 RepID=UPI001F3A5F7A|nr:MULTISPECIES: tetratricopeptide repeat protein [unclassified Streptomyces]